MELSGFADDRDELDGVDMVDMATYYLVDSRDNLQLNVTPTFIALLQEMTEVLIYPILYLLYLRIRMSYSSTRSY